MYCSFLELASNIYTSVDKFQKLIQVCYHRCSLYQQTTNGFSKNSNSRLLDNIQWL